MYLVKNDRLILLNFEQSFFKAQKKLPFSEQLSIKNIID